MNFIIIYCFYKNIIKFLLNLYTNKKLIKLFFFCIESYNFSFNFLIFCSHFLFFFRYRDGSVRLRNPNIELMDQDILYHLALGSGSHDLVEMFGDVKVNKSNQFFSSKQNN